ncbi:MAG: FAD-dependent thymidylate synthase [Nitrosopumilus sp.]|nr:FAD-dependent thymidylate synthase [Nitrosopumilus sp.]MDA7957785.1 FAD-dependent thymidylate synthase [Nitrosopumilus sp.]
MEFTDEERRKIEGHFTNADGRVFAVTTPSQADRGALMSRYSRTSKSMRRVFLDEFLGNESRGEQFYERVLSGYGDDSVAELGAAQLGIEGVSNVAVKKIEDRRIGLSYLEKSSRYVKWDAKRDGKYMYYRGDDIMGSRHAGPYTDACDMAFDLYSRSIDPMTRMIQEAHPEESFMFPDSADGREKPISELGGEDREAAARARAGMARARALDALRSLLPAATLTNVGVTGNGRAFEYMLDVLGSSRLAEERGIAAMAKTELDRVIGAFVRRHGGPHGEANRGYLGAVRAMQEEVGGAAGGGPGGPVELVEHGDEGAELDRVIAGIICEGSGSSFKSALGAAAAMDRGKKAGIVGRIASLRANRRHRPPRAFEHVRYTFDMCTNFGMFRDLHRHRALTLQRHLLGAGLGYHVPDEIRGLGIEREFGECMGASGDAWAAIRRDDPDLAQYPVNFAYNYRYVMSMNLREACHLIELRTMPQGHEDYRRVAISMLEQISEVHPALAAVARFADTKRQGSGRYESERRAELRKLKTKISNPAGGGA